MKNKALIGHTGFIGGVLKQQQEFTHFYNSKNIFEIQDKEFDLVISCGNSSSRWLVNQKPTDDLDNIKRFTNYVSTIKAKKFVLLSTIDVYNSPVNVDEDTPGSKINNNSYGQNRYFLETEIQTLFLDHTIVRLPIMYGHGFKKNIIFDALNKNELNKVNGNASVQIYNTKNLTKDLSAFIASDNKIINLATEPVIVRDFYRKVFNINLDNNINTYFEYNMQTKYSPTKYFYSKQEIIDELREFKIEYESMRK